MVAMSAIYKPIAAPAAVPYPFGLFSVAPPQPITDQHQLSGVQWQDLACGAAAGYTADPCVTGDDVDPLEVTNACPATFKYKPTTVYAFLRRSGDELTIDKVAAGSLLEAVEQGAAEASLWAALMGEVSPADEGSAELALARVEYQLRQQYSGTGVIHLTPYVASLLTGVSLVRNGNKLTTNLGTPVIAGGGYGTDTDDERTIVGTGPLVVLRDSLNTDASVMNRATNDIYTIAQRTYVLGWDCIALATTYPAPS